MICKKCGCGFPNGNTRCPICGAIVEKSPQVENTCPLSNETLQPAYRENHKDGTYGVKNGTVDKPDTEKQRDHGGDSRIRQSWKNSWLFTKIMVGVFVGAVIFGVGFYFFVYRPEMNKYRDSMNRVISIYQSGDYEGADNLLGEIQKYTYKDREEYEMYRLLVSARLLYEDGEYETTLSQLVNIHVLDADTLRENSNFIVETQAMIDEFRYEDAYQNVQNNSMVDPGIQQYYLLRIYGDT